MLLILFLLYAFCERVHVASLFDDAELRAHESYEKRALTAHSHAAKLEYDVLMEGGFRKRLAYDVVTAAHWALDGDKNVMDARCALRTGGAAPPTIEIEVASWRQALLDDWARVGMLLASGPAFSACADEHDEPAAFHVRIVRVLAKNRAARTVLVAVEPAYAHDMFQRATVHFRFAPPRNLTAARALYRSPKRSLFPVALEKNLQLACLGMNWNCSAHATDERDWMIYDGSALQVVCNECSAHLLFGVDVKFEIRDAWFRMPWIETADVALWGEWGSVMNVTERYVAWFRPMVWTKTLWRRRLGSFPVSVAGLPLWGVFTGILYSGLEFKGMFPLEVTAGRAASSTEVRVGMRFSRARPWRSGPYATFKTSGGGLMLPKLSMMSAADVARWSQWHAYQPKAFNVTAEFSPVTPSLGFAWSLLPPNLLDPTNAPTKTFEFSLIPIDLFLWPAAGFKFYEGDAATCALEARFYWGINLALRIGVVTIHINKPWEWYWTLGIDGLLPIDAAWPLTTLGEPALCGAEGCRFCVVDGAAPALTAAPTAAPIAQPPASLPTPACATTTTQAACEALSLECAWCDGACALASAAATGVCVAPAPPVLQVVALTLPAALKIGSVVELALPQPLPFTLALVAGDDDDNATIGAGLPWPGTMSGARVLWRVRWTRGDSFYLRATDANDAYLWQSSAFALVGVDDAAAPYLTRFGECDRVCGDGGVQRRTVVGAPASDVPAAALVASCPPAPPCADAPLALEVDVAFNGSLLIKLAGGTPYQAVHVEYLLPTCDAWQLLWRVDAAIAGVAREWQPTAETYFYGDRQLTHVRVVSAPNATNRAVTRTPLRLRLPDPEPAFTAPVTHWRVSSEPPLPEGTLLGSFVVEGEAQQAVAFENVSVGDVVAAPGVDLRQPSAVRFTELEALGVGLAYVYVKPAAVTGAADPRKFRIAPPADEQLSLPCGAINGAWTCAETAAPVVEDDYRVECQWLAAADYAALPFDASMLEAGELYEGGFKKGGGGELSGSSGSGSGYWIFSNDVAFLAALACVSLCALVVFTACVVKFSRRRRSRHRPRQASSSSLRPSMRLSERYSGSHLAATPAASAPATPALVSSSDRISQSGDSNVHRYRTPTLSMSQDGGSGNVRHHRASSRAHTRTRGMSAVPTHRPQFI